MILDKKAEKRIRLRSLLRKHFPLAPDRVVDEAIEDILRNYKRKK